MSLSSRIFRITLKGFRSISLAGTKLSLPARVRQDAILKEISSRREALDEFERSYRQFLCQKRLGSQWKFLFFEFGSLAALPLFLIVSLFPRRTAKVKAPASAVIFSPFVERVPKEIACGHECARASAEMVILPRDLAFLASLALRYLFSPYFVLKIAFKVANYRANLLAHPNAEVFAVSTEFSFASSALTAWCRREGLRHVNFMHGEKLFFIRDAWVSFHEFYVWDEHYVRLFRSLHAASGQFKVEAPAFRIDALKPKNPPVPRLTYYLQMATEGQLVQLKRYLESLSDKFSVVVRPHPQYSDRALVQRVLGNLPIEDADFPLEESLRESDYVATVYSTVLYQAYLSGKGCIIDDLFDPALFAQLQSLDYIMLSKPITLMSSLFQKISLKTVEGPMNSMQQHAQSNESRTE